MTAYTPSLLARITKIQGTAARMLAHLPRPMQRKLAQALGYDSQAYPALDPHVQILLAIRKLSGSTEAIGRDAEKSRRAFRRDMASIVGRPTPVAASRDFTIPARSGMLDVRHYIPQGFSEVDRLPLLVFFHGGGFVIGDLNTHDEPCRLICNEAQMQVLSVEYRLAPEHPSPCGVEDCLDALRWAHQHAAKLGADPSRVCVGGDSAGGNLSAAVSQLARGHIYAPAAQLLIYPAVDASRDYPSHSAYSDDLMLGTKDIENAVEATLLHSHITRHHPIASPLLGKLHNLAPALVITAEFDVLRDEGQHYAEKLLTSGTPCVYELVRHLPHGFINLTAINPTARAATIKLARDFRTLLDETNASQAVKVQNRRRGTTV